MSELLQLHGSVEDDLTPIVRVYEDKANDEVVVDWNPPVTAEAIPEHLEPELRRYARQQLRSLNLTAIGFIGSTGYCGAAPVIYGAHPGWLIATAPFTLASTGVAAATAMAHINYYFRGTDRRMMANHYNGYDNQASRQIRLSATQPAASMTTSEVGDSLLAEANEALNAIFDETSLDSPFTLLSPTHNQTMAGIMAAKRKQLLSNKHHEHSPNAESLAYEDMLHDPTFWTSLPASTRNTVKELNRRKQQYETYALDERTLLFDIAPYLKTVTDTRHIEAALPELYGLATITSTPQYFDKTVLCKAIIDFSQAIKRSTQRQDILAI